MTPKKKAYELCNKFYQGSVFDYEFIEGHLEEKERAKERALICVDEILQQAQMIETEYNGYDNPYQYFLQVKQEIYKL